LTELGEAEERGCGELRLNLPFGQRWFNLGMAPFSGLEARDLAFLTSKFGAYRLRYG
jgi:hypothetical protein